MQEGLLIYTKNAKHEVIFYEEIIYITVQKHYIIVKLTDGRTLSAKYSLKQIQEKLPPTIFFRTHRNYIVSLRHMKTVGVDTIIVRGNEEVLLTQEIRKSLFSLFTVIGSGEKEGARDGISPPHDQIPPPRALSSEPPQNPS